MGSVNAEANGISAASSRNTVMATYHAGAERLNLSCSTTLLASPVARSLPVDLVKMTALAACMGVFPALSTLSQLPTLRHPSVCQVTNMSKGTYCVVLSEGVPSICSL